MEDLAKKYTHIKGWGIDIDPKNDPTYPIKKRTDLEQLGYSWPRPTQQPINIEVLHSIERPNITAVFGTAAPPSGLSGMIRRFAFKYSENSYGHWLPLLVADRVNVVEGVLDDISQGRFPNIFAERGGKAEWKYNKTGMLTKIAIGAAIAGAALYLLTRNDEDED
ncbi:MAG: hypothetical protein LPJ89_02095 [Hymenobacteraceae bacterium]|nr:hypothetical protein [Hymenobacteraceae bacterium]MDX5395773.1 hypothetical protein [Hymenobacteraceae bacterium]MDX5442555.1 hypothetical protein [Hymenobacteraceae bacterium]MDX5511828.1 hypothetical protein [Hymenobacteraceae bacterium]